MEEELKPKKKKVIPIIALVVLTVLVIALGSYAYWQITRKQRNRNALETACLNITYSDGYNDINLRDAYPRNNNDWANLEPYTFTIKNECNKPVNYIIALESIEDSNLNYSDYLNYSFLRVKLDSDESMIYGNLQELSNDYPQSYTVRDTKKITEHTLGAYGSTTHSLRIWLDENTPAQNADESLNTSKYFYGKVKIIAGEGINGDPTATSSYEPEVPATSTATSSSSSTPIISGADVLRKENGTAATTSNISVGDKVHYGSEEFYVISKGAHTATLLSRYLINVGSNPNPNSTYGLQSAELVRTRTDVNDETSATYYNIEGTNWRRYGTLQFSSSSYWPSLTASSTATSTSNYYDFPFVYNDQSNLKQYVDDYVNTLRTNGLNVDSGTVMSIQQVGALCNTSFSYYAHDYSNCPNYIFETQYWLGSAYNDDRIWSVDAGRQIYKGYCNDDYGGVRPVIYVGLQ